MLNDSNCSLVWVGLLLIQNRKLLTTREKGKDLFQLPGGGMKDEESYEDTLRREVYEELCLEINNPKIFDDFILPGRHENLMIRFLVYTADILGEIKKGEEIEEIRWIDSNYQAEGLDVGNAAKLKVIPRLLQEGILR